MLNIHMLRMASDQVENDKKNAHENYENSTGFLRPLVWIQPFDKISLSLKQEKDTRLNYCAPDDFILSDVHGK